MIRRFIFPKSSSWSKDKNWGFNPGSYAYGLSWRLEDLWSMCWATNRDWSTK
jgi:hypothetical protein